MEGKNMTILKRTSAKIVQICGEFTVPKCSEKKTVWKKWHWFNLVHPMTRTSFCFRKRKRNGGLLDGVKSLKSPKLELLNSSILFSPVKLVFRARASVCWQTDGHIWSRCTKRSAIRPGFKTVPQPEQAAHGQVRQNSSKWKGGFSSKVWLSLMGL